MQSFTYRDNAFIMPAEISDPFRTSWLECSCCRQLLFEKHNMNKIPQTCPHCGTLLKHIILDKNMFYVLLSCGDIVKTTDNTETSNVLSDEEIATFNAYLEDNDMPTAFGNSDFVSIYKKIIGNATPSDKIQKWIDRSNDTER